MDIFFESSIYALQKKGGISRIYNEVIPRICNDRNHQITIITTQKNIQPLPSHKYLRKIDFSKLNRFNRRGSDWKTIYEDFFCWIEPNTYKKIFHSTYYNSFRNWRGPKVLSVYDMIYEKYPEYFNSKDDIEIINRKKKAFAISDLLLCISQTTANDLKTIDLSLEKRINVVYLAPSDIFQKVKTPSILEISGAKKPFLLYVGNRGLYKNFSEFLNVYSLWKQNKNVDLCAVGPKWNDDEQSTISKIKLSNNIQLITDLDDRNLCFLYNQASAFVFPSMWEGFGIPVLEAMACGCPVVASRIPSTIEIAGDLPYYFDIGNTESFLSALDQAVDEGRDSEKVLKGLFYVKKFSWDKTTADILNVYSSLI